MKTSIAIALCILSIGFGVQAQTVITQASIPLAITAPGSFIVGGNLTGVPGGPTAGIGILIAADGVTIDMNGYSFTGVPGCQHGIFTYLSRQNITIKNGNLRNWPGDGVQATSARNIQLSNVRASVNGGAGLRLGQAALVENCQALSNGLMGISVRDGSSVRGSTATANFGNGIEGTNGCTISDCVAYLNRGNGIRVGTACRVFDNLCVSNGTALINNRSGIVVDGSGSLVKNNHTAGGNQGIEINGFNNILVGNTMANNADDLQVSSGNISGLEVNIETSLQAAANALINIAQ